MVKELKTLIELATYMGYTGDELNNLWLKKERKLRNDRIENERMSWKSLKLRRMHKQERLKCGNVSHICCSLANLAFMDNKV